MPIYEYRCLDCGANLEKRQGISEPPLTVCERCGGKLEKQWSLSGFQFKGAGWYVTDYSGKKVETKPESKEKTTSERSEKNSPGESTAKPETASNTKQDGDSSSKKD